MITVGPYSRPWIKSHSRPWIKSPDLAVESHGSIFLFRPQTQAGREFLAEHAPDEAQWFGLALVVEHRYANDWALNALEQGLALH